MVDVFKALSLSEALGIRRDQKVIPFAGGTDLMVRYRSWSGTNPVFDRPVLLIGDIEGLKTIRADKDWLIIGSSATLTELLEAQAIPQDLKSVLIQMASPAVRNVATIGGNICNASPAADTLPYLYATDATVYLQNQTSFREIPIRDFILGPGHTVLAEDELLVSIRIPLKNYDFTQYRKVGTRKANALTKVSFFGIAAKKDDYLTEVHMSLGAVGPTVVRSLAAEQILKGLAKVEIPTVRDAVQDSLSPLIQPIDDQRSSKAYRQSVARRLVDTFLLDLMKF